MTHNDSKVWVRTLGDPVKESSLKRGSVVNRSAPSREHGRTLNAPLGRCGAADSTSAIISAPIGVREAGLSTKGHLHARDHALSISKISHVGTHLPVAYARLG